MATQGNQALHKSNRRLSYQAHGAGKTTTWQNWSLTEPTCLSISKVLLEHSNAQFTWRPWVLSLQYHWVFSSRLHILHQKYLLPVLWQKHCTSLGLAYQAQIPEELKEAPAPLNEMQPLPKCFVSLPRTTNTPIILKLEQMHVTGEELFIRPKT